MKNLITMFFDLFRYHKIKLFIAFASCLFFILLFFPFGDLGTLVTTQVAKATQNTVFIKFEDLGLSLIPQIGLKFKNVEVQTPTLPPLKAKQLTVSPSLLGLLTFKPGVSLSAVGLFKGDVDLTTRGGSKKENGVARQQISLNAQDVDLRSALSMFTNASGIDGTMNFKADGILDPQFIDQPIFSLQISGEKIQMISYSIPTMLGPFKLPDLTLRKIDVKGDLKSGSLDIESAELGTEQDPLYTKAKGKIDIAIHSVNGQVTIEPKSYDLTVLIQAKNSFKDQADIFLSFISKFQSPTAAQGKTEYLFRIASPDVRAPPNMTAVATY